MTKKRILFALIAPALLALALNPGWAQEKKELSLTLEDSIVRALRNNLNVAAEVINPNLAAASVDQAKQMFTPTLQFDVNGNRYEQLSTWSLQTAGTYVNRSTTASTTVQQLIPYGGRLTASLSYDYSKTNQLFQSYNPSYTGRLQFQLTQPLLKGFGRTVSRRQIVIAQNSFDLSRSQFKTVLIDT